MWWRCSAACAPCMPQGQGKACRGGHRSSGSTCSARRACQLVKERTLWRNGCAALCAAVPQGEELHAREGGRRAPRWPRRSRRCRTCCRARASCTARPQGVSEVGNMAFMTRLVRAQTLAHPACKASPLHVAEHEGICCEPSSVFLEVIGSKLDRAACMTDAEQCTAR